VSAAQLAAAVDLARQHGLRVEDPVVLKDGSNVLVHLRPAPVVARVPGVTARFRHGDAWLAREVAVAHYLHDAGASVVGPSPEIAPGPHHRDGYAMTFWEYAQPSGEDLDAAAAGAALRDCHELLLAYDADLPRHALLDEARALVDLLDLPDGAAERLRAAGERLAARLDELDAPLQPVHGDADLGNAIQTAAGPRWNDWEDVCLAPRAWDLACLDDEEEASRDAVAAAIKAYGSLDDGPEALEACRAARRYQETVWTFAFAEQRPGLAPMAAELLKIHAPA
jgi:hypothetical protein